MSFNSNTYRMNQARKEAWASLAKAREIKDRAARGEAYAWERGDMVTAVRIARLSMHQMLCYRELKRIDGEL